MLDLAPAPLARASAPRPSPLNVIELRQYTLHPGQRDTLIDLFEAQFIETQEDAGIQVLGTFRDLDDPDRFVWLRGFADMATRAEALERFYRGPCWQQHRNAANATMIDSDNVLLLQPASDGHAMRPADQTLPPRDASVPDEGRIVIGLHYFDSPVAEDWLEHFAQVQKPWLESLRAQVLGTLVSEYADNTFPALPVRQGEHVFACVLQFASEADHERCDRQLQATWRLGSQPRRHELLRLVPTARSRMGR